METKSILPVETEPVTPEGRGPLDPGASDLAERVRALEAELLRRQEREDVLRAALDETTHSASRLLDSLRAERDARERAEAESRFKDESVAVLAHDLKNPLANVLTAVRLLVARQDVSPDARKRLERVIVGGSRMQRMIDQVADVTEERRGGQLVATDEEHDVAQLVELVVAETRDAHPARTLTLRSGGAAVRLVDRHRLLQALRTLIGNAVVHGVVDRPVHVAVVGRTTEVDVDIHNDGPPIDDAARAELFDPRRRRRTPSSDGLGFGLYLCKRIIAAHDGRLELASTAEHGTTFRVVLPLR